MFKRKNVKFFAGIALVVNAATTFIMFLVTLGRRKSSSGSLLALSALTGAAGAYLIYDAKCEDDEQYCDGCECDGDCDNCPCDADCDDCPCGEAVEINESELFSRESEEEKTDKE